MSARGQDLATLVSGLQRIAGAAGTLRQRQLQNFLKYSSLKNVKIPETPPPVLQDLTAKELAQKSFLVVDNTALFAQVFRFNLFFLF
jgi:hypothetical protein